MDLPPPTLLVLRALGLGDLLTSLPALRGLRAAYPHHHKVLATTAGVAPLARHAGVADEVLVTAPLTSLGWAARDRGRPAVAVNLHGRGPHSHSIVAATRPRRTIAFGTMRHRGPPWREREHEVSRWCRLLAESGISADPALLDLDAPSWARVPERARGATLIHPGAASASRRWPPARWAAVARAESEAGRRVVVTGGSDEVRLARAVASMARLPASAAIAGRAVGSVLGLAALVAAADRVACGDTGVAHLATALGKPSAVLFGPVSPALWGPPPDRPQHVALWAGREGDPHGRCIDPGLLKIAVPDVLHALDTAVAGGLALDAPDSEICSTASDSGH